MDTSTLFRKVKEKFSIIKLIRYCAFSFNSFSLKLFEDNYKERPEVGPVNFEVKLQRLKNGGTF